MRLAESSYGEDRRPESIEPGADEPASGGATASGLQDGDDVTYLDLGDAMLLFPGRIADLRAEVLASITDADWEEANRGFGDPEEATE